MSFTGKSHGAKKQKKIFKSTGDVSRREEDEKLCDTPAFKKWEWDQYQKLLEQDTPVTYPALPQPTASPSLNHTFSQTRAIGFKHGFDNGNCDACDTHCPDLVLVPQDTR